MPPSCQDYELIDSADSMTSWLRLPRELANLVLGPLAIVEDPEFSPPVVLSAER